MLSNNYRSVVHYYSQYHGHDIEKLEAVHAQLRGNDPNKPRPCVFLAGDSSFDNKYWFQDRADAINGFENVLDPPIMKKDIAYWLNYEAQNKHHKNWFCLNCAVEESALLDRKGPSKLLPQDEFIRDHIRPEDTLIVSVGGNDIALKVTPSTVVNMLALTHLTTKSWVEYANKCACNKWSCVTCTLTRPFGMSYFVGMFKAQVQRYLEKIVSKTKPKRIVICIIYYPLEAKSSEPCWADRALSALNYDSNPQKLQSIIRTVYHLATEQIVVRGTEVVPFPLFTVLDGKNPKDYVARVEPSASGGAKIGKALAKLVGATTPDDQ